MTPENIKQLKEDFEALEKARSKKVKMYSVIEHLGKTGRNDAIVVYNMKIFSFVNDTIYRKYIRMNWTCA